MSTKSLGQKIALMVLGAMILSLVVSGIRQLSVHRRLDLRLKERERRLSELKEENRALRRRAEEVQSLKFVDEQAQKLMGIKSATSSSEPGFLPKTPEDNQNPPEFHQDNYQKWFSLFFY